MSRLQALHTDCAQSPWLDNLRREWLASGELQGWIDKGVRGLTSNPSIFAAAMTQSDAYDDDLARLVADGASVRDAYWSLVVADIEGALGVLSSVYQQSGGEDGYVSVEVAPDLAHDAAATVVAARELDDRISAPNLYIKVPATVEGVGAIETLVSEGRSVNVTLIFSLERYQQVADAYLAGLEAYDGDLSEVSSVASFFISRVDTEVDRRLTDIGTPEALALRGKTAVAQAQVAYQMFVATFSGERWERLAARGARPQRPLWASTSTKNPDYPDTLYVDALIGPHTVNTLPDATLAAFADHGTVARTIDVDPDGAAAVLRRVTEVGVDLDDVSAVLESQGVASFATAFDEVLGVLAERAAAVSG